MIVYVHYWNGSLIWNAPFSSSFDSISHFEFFIQELRDSFYCYRLFIRILLCIFQCCNLFLNVWSEQCIMFTCIVTWLHFIILLILILTVLQDSTTLVQASDKSSECDPPLLFSFGNLLANLFKHIPLTVHLSTLIPLPGSWLDSGRLRV